MGTVRDFFKKLFGINPERPYEDPLPQSTQIVLLNGDSSDYPRAITADLYAQSLVRSIVDRIALYGSMISLQHVRGEGSNFEIVDDKINRLLTLRPNSFMSASQMFYRMWTDLFCGNDSYLWVKPDSAGNPDVIVPIIASSVQMKNSNGFLFYVFSFENSQKVAVPIEQIIHLRRYYYKNDIFGTSNTPLESDLALMGTMQTSIAAAMKNGAQIKGILKHANTVSPEDLEAQEKLFRESYLKASNSGGIGMIDAKFDFIPISYSGKTIDSDQMKEIRDYVYRYFHVNDDLLMSSYTSEKWQAFHETVMAPLLNDLEQCASIALFSETELGYKNRIKSSVNQITFMSPALKVQMVKLALDGRLYNPNEIRGWFGDAPIPGGDQYQMSKNFELAGANSDPQNTKTKEEENPVAPKEEENAEGES